MRNILFLLAICLYSFHSLADTRTYSECLIEDTSADSYYLGHINAVLSVEKTSVGTKLILKIFEDYDSKPDQLWETRKFKKRHIHSSNPFVSGRHKIIKRFMGVEVGGIEESFFLSPDSVTIIKYISSDYNKSVTCYK